MTCPGTCDGSPESHSEDDWVLGENDEPMLTAWTGGEPTPICIDWCCQGSWVEEVSRASNWSQYSQPIGNLDALPGSIVDGVILIRQEWDRIMKEEMDNK